MRTRLAGAVVLLIACVGADAANAAADGSQSAARAAARAKCMYVDGEQQCLKPGQRCKRRFRSDYLVGGLDCVRRRGKLRLVKAGDAALRQGRFVHLQPNGYPSLSTTLQAFDKIVADLPGVKPKRGVVGDSGGDVTSLMLWMDHYRKRLTRAQRAVLKRVTTPKEIIGEGAAASQVTPQQGQLWVSFMEEARRRLRAHGLPFNHQYRLMLGAPDRPDAAAWVQAEFLAKGSTCDIYVTNSALAEPEPSARIVAIHEMVHCAQAEFAVRKTDLVGKSAWVIEGSADWAAGKVALEWVGPLADLSRLAPPWLAWFQHPEIDVTARQYDAIGFFALMEHQGVDVWPMIGQLVTANQGGNAYAAYALATGQMFDVQHEWGPSHASQPPAGRRWDLQGPGMPRQEWFMARIQDGTSYGGVPIQGRAGVSIGLSIEADVVTISPTVGIKGILRRTDSEEGELMYSAYCTRPEGCQCDGEDIGLEAMPKGAAIVGYASQPSAGGTVRVDGDSLDSYCDKGQHPFKAGHGITLYDQNGTIVTEFASGSCSIQRDGFHAVARSGVWRLNVTIKGVTRRPNDQIYDVAYRGGRANFTVTGPGGPFGNEFWPPGSDPPGAGVMGFGDRGLTFGIGMYPVVNRAFDTSVIVLGGMKCVYPRPKRRP